MKTLAQVIASVVTQIQNLQGATTEGARDRWLPIAEERLRVLVNQLPHGSGIDGTNEVLIDECTDNKIVISTSFHHLNEAGYYDGWTSHKVIATGSLLYGLDVRVTGRNKNDIKNYLEDVFYTALTADCP